MTAVLRGCFRFTQRPTFDQRGEPQRFRRAVAEGASVRDLRGNTDLRSSVGFGSEALVEMCMMPTSNCAWRWAFRPEQHSLSISLGK